MDKKWRGIQTNFSLFQGEIIADPVNNGEYTFMTLRTKILQRDQNGQFVEADQDVPLMIEPTGPTSVVRNHVKAGRKLQAWCTYKTWIGGDATAHHTFVVRSIDLGDKPYEGPDTKKVPSLPQ